MEKTKIQLEKKLIILQDTIKNNNKIVYEFFDKSNIFQKNFQFQNCSKN